MTTSPSPEEIVQAHVELWNLTFGYLKSMALDCAFRLGIPNAIYPQPWRRGVAVSPRRGPSPSITPTQEAILSWGTLSVGDPTGILAQHDTDDTTTYRLTPMSRLLVDDATVNGCTSGALAHHQHLPEWFLGGDGAVAIETPFRMKYDGSWDAARSDPHFNEVFDARMETDSHLVLEFAILGCGEALIAGYVMHDWSDDVCVKILTQCKKAICSQKPNGGGKVIIIDAIVGSPCKAMFEAQVLLDLLMMAVTSGKERDEEVRRKIFTEAGFRHYEAKPLLGFMSIIELYP
ncbi:5-pentadecatrienyl resorcinol O-methyltransferase [Panicum miliaceum]|uniref:5-pentadecatrienyl resorcinol O-methyltransferase n=1 Tax=Panicum miliaceum TaxID=4540 RepID=A0A3L6R901_PANMI|nr:5-pentadecatrienyl resorcinol O-methyltransferase [Panicum miliaceum]